jgi:hypothetical protein
MVEPALTPDIARACTDPAILCWVEAHSGLAGWAQAVGGIIAIVAAFVVGRMPILEQRRRERKSSLRKVENYARTLRGARFYAGSLRTVASAGNLRSLNFQFRGLVAAQKELAAQRTALDDLYDREVARRVEAEITAALRTARWAVRFRNAKPAIRAANAIVSAIDHALWLLDYNAPEGSKPYSIPEKYRSRPHAAASD